MKIQLRTFAILWLLFFGIAATISRFFAEAIESHTLSRALQFGFDAFGRSCILLSFEAAFRSLVTVIPATLVCICVSLLLSFVSMTDHPKIKFIWLSGTDTLSAVPGFLIALAMTAFFGNEPSTRWIGVTLAALFLVLPYLVRFFESQIRQIKETDYVTSSEAIGATRFQIFVRHILPELARSIISLFPFLLTRLLVIETSLSFLGLDFGTSRQTWGGLLAQGSDYLLEAPWISIFSGVPLFLTLFSFHLLSEHEQN